MVVWGRKLLRWLGRVAAIGGVAALGRSPVLRRVLEWKLGGFVRVRGSAVGQTPIRHVRRGVLGEAVQTLVRVVHVFVVTQHPLDATGQLIPFVRLGMKRKKKKKFSSVVLKIARMVLCFFSFFFF